jgi:hypothetical protein
MLASLQETKMEKDVEVEHNQIGKYPDVEA